MASALKQLMEMMLRNSTRVLVEAVEDRKRQQNGVTTVKNYIRRLDTFRHNKR